MALSLSDNLLQYLYSLFENSVVIVNLQRPGLYTDGLLFWRGGEEASLLRIFSLHNIYRLDAGHIARILDSGQDRYSGHAG